MAGPIMDTACITYEGVSFEQDLFPRTKEPIWILGKNYSTNKGEDSIHILRDIRSRIWCTYRKNFSAIGGTGPTADSGWGCMLRCGQMILAEALIYRHLGRDWQWEPDDNNVVYMQILQNFLDKKDSLYSIHQIAQMGVSEGKSVGSWFGPNTVAQVLKKLMCFDDWSSLCIHIAMDNTVIINDIKTLCKRDSPTKTHGEATSYSRTSAGVGRQRGAAGGSDTKDGTKHRQQGWRPLLLFIPLRLGLSEMNSVYNEPFKACFTFRQSVGVIGGKPNHAYYFIGYYGNTLLYLDPHTTQQAVNPEKLSQIPDESYHCAYPSRMNIADLDPSIALGFFCHSEEDFDDLCLQIHKHIHSGHRRPMFELAAVRPPHWPSLEIPQRPGDELNRSQQSDFTELSYESDDTKEFDTDGEYEIL
ncbi:cysteine protease ATG4B-like [Pocillopora damicornis]|uniref:cysteine protease ATG4B-like n=1 Tax=Pocillopora damicornis TaxID=46731 RepID=UPI000F555D49|nr:cysteine protease ATG4B-like [Pocillopora damicornis]